MYNIISLTEKYVPRIENAESYYMRGKNERIRL